MRSDDKGNHIILVILKCHNFKIKNLKDVADCEIRNTVCTVFDFRAPKTF